MRLRNLKKILVHEHVVVEYKNKQGCKCIKPLFTGNIKNCYGDFLDLRVDKIYHGKYLNEQNNIADSLYIFIV